MRHHEGVRALLAAIRCGKARSRRTSPGICGRGVLRRGRAGLVRPRTTEDSWRAGFSWWTGCGLGDAQRHARRLGLWIALAGQAGTTEDEDFPGLAALVSPDGSVSAQLPDWREGTLVVDIPL
jgi:hypothetical protein